MEGDDLVPLQEAARRNREKAKKEAEKVVTISGAPEFYNEAVMLARRLYEEKGSLTNIDIQSLIEPLGYKLWYNEVLMRPEYHRSELKVWNGEPLPMSDGVHAKIIDELRVLGDFSGKKIAKILGNRHVTNAALSAAIADESNRRNPIINYLHDSQVRYGEPSGAFDVLAGHFHDRDGLTKVFLKKWMLGCLARELFHFQNYTLVLQGEQGIGKSTFTKWLCSGLGTAYYQEGLIVPSDKDHRLRLVNKWIWAVDEFGESMGKQARAALKAFLTQEQVSERPAYGKYVIQARRHCNIIATTNDDSFLYDPTGNRRYIVLFLDSIDHAYINMKPDEVWGDLMQQLAFDIENKPWLLTPDEVKAQKANNLNAEEEDPLETFLDDEFKYEPESSFSMPIEQVYSRVFTRFDAHGDRGKEMHLIKLTKTILTKKWKVHFGRSAKIRYFKGLLFKK